MVEIFTILNMFILFILLCLFGAFKDFIRKNYDSRLSRLELEVFNYEYSRSVQRNDSSN